MTTASAGGVLLLDSDRTHIGWIARIVRTVAPATELTASLDGVRPLEEYDLVVANYDGLAEADQLRLFEAVNRGHGDQPRLLLVSQAICDYGPLLLELERHGLTNLLAQEEHFTSAPLIVTLQKLLQGDIFGLERYFGWGVQPRLSRLRSSSEKDAVVDEVTEYATNLGVHQRLVENVATAVDELVTNALFNAPVDDAGAARFAHLARTTAVTLEADEEIVVAYCSDGQSFGVSVTDPFGTISKQETLAYLVRCLRRAEDSPTEKGGAGLGLYMTLGSLNHLILNISPGRRTEVIGLLDISGNYRNFVQRGKSLNIFHDPRSGP